MKHIIIEKNIDILTKEVWEFSYISGHIYLDAYTLETRESKKHRKYKILKKYYRIQSRDNNISEEDVSVSDELKQEVLTKFVQDIKVLKWNER